MGYKRRMWRGKEMKGEEEGGRRTGRVGGEGGKTEDEKRVKEEVRMKESEGEKDLRINGCGESFGRESGKV